MPVAFSLSHVEHCQKGNDAESVFHCLCCARTLVFWGRKCALLQFSADTSQGERRRKKYSISFGIYKLRDITVKPKSKL